MELSKLTSPLPAFQPVDPNAAIETAPPSGPTGVSHPLLDGAHSRPAELRRGDFANYAEGSRRTELGTPNSKYKEYRPIIQVKMGQGVVGHLKEIKACSKDHFSCPAIVFFNSETNRGGIFHVPAGWDKAPRIVKQSIFAIMKEIQPNTVYLDKRPPESWDEVGYKIAAMTTKPGQEDWRPIECFIRKECEFTGTFAETPKSVSGGTPSQFLVYLDDSDTLSIETRWSERTAVNLGKDDTEEGAQRIVKAMEEFPQCVKFGIDLWPNSN